MMWVIISMNDSETAGKVLLSAGGIVQFATDYAQVFSMIAIVIGAVCMAFNAFSNYRRNSITKRNIVLDLMKAAKDNGEEDAAELIKKLGGV